MPRLGLERGAIHRVDLEHPTAARQVIAAAQSIEPCVELRDRPGIEPGNHRNLDNYCKIGVGTWCSTVCTRRIES